MRRQPSGINNFWISGPCVCIDTVAHSAPPTAFCFLNEMLVLKRPMYRVLETPTGPCWCPEQRLDLGRLSLFASVYSLTHHLANTGVLLPSLPTQCAAVRSEGPGQRWFLSCSFFPLLHCPAVPHTPGAWEDIYQVPPSVAEKSGSAHVGDLIGVGG